MRLVPPVVLLAFVTFCVVQDRVTAAAAREYVALHQQAGVDAPAPVTLDEAMRPGIARAVRRGALAGGAVVVVGVVVSGWRGRRRP